MSTVLNAHKVSLELPMDLQKVMGERNGRFAAALAGNQRIQSRVLDGIDFKASPGDRIGVMGLNGAGKTTLLRVLNGAYHPTSGVVERRGVVQSLLTTTLGFNENATVVENVYLRGTAMGLRYRQLQAVMDDILGFAGLTDRANQYLHVLSSGQRMRLGFAITTAVQPDILLMDEWIGAGDAAFIKRARERMLGRFHNSSIVVLASHSTALLREMCDKALVLDKGEMRFYGDIADGLEAYRQIVSTASVEDKDAVIGADPLLFGGASGVVERLRIADGFVELEGWAISGKDKEVLVVYVETEQGKCQTGTFERVDREDVRLYLGKRSGRFGFRVKFPADKLLDEAGRYSQIRVSAGDGAGVGSPLPLANGAVVVDCVA